jgi:hypothetical protein
MTASLAEQSVLLNRIAEELRQLRTIDGSYVRLSAWGLQAALGITCRLYEPSEDPAYAVSARQLLVTGQLFELLADLRIASYRPGRGTWFFARLSIDHTDQLNVSFDYDSEPTILENESYTKAEYLEELERFPREVEHQPSWLRKILA